MSILLLIVDLILISSTIGLFIASIFWPGVLLHHIAGLLTVANIIIVKYRMGYIDYRIDYLEKCINAAESSKLIQ